MDPRVLRWLLNMEIMHEYRLASRVPRVELSGRPRLGWMDSVKSAEDSREMIGGSCRALGEKNSNGETRCICKIIND